MYNTDCIENIKADFLAAVAQSEDITVSKAKLRDWQRLLPELMKLFSSLL